MNVFNQFSNQYFFFIFKMLSSFVLDLSSLVRLYLEFKKNLFLFLCFCFSCEVP